VWPFRPGTTTSAKSAVERPLKSEDFEELVKRISLLRGDLIALQSAQEQQRERLASLAGKLYATVKTEPPKEEAKPSNTPELVYL